MPDLESLSESSVVAVPLSTTAKTHPPITIPVTCQGQPAVAIIDQVRAVGKHRLKNRVESMPLQQLNAITRAIAEILELQV